MIAIIKNCTICFIFQTRTPKPQTECRLPVSKAKSVYDREKFKEGFREIRTHNKLPWVPG